MHCFGCPSKLAAQSGMGVVPLADKTLNVIVAGERRSEPHTKEIFHGEGHQAVPSEHSPFHKSEVVVGHSGSLRRSVT